MSNDKHRAYDKAMSRLNRLAGMAWFVLLVERMWLLLWPPIGVILLFLTLSWLDLWRVTPDIPRLILLVLLLGTFIYCCGRLFKFRLPNISEALARIDQDSNLPHGQAKTFNDHLAIGQDSLVARTFWQMHREQACHAIAGMRVAMPKPNMPRHDRFAIRAILVLVTVASGFLAGSEKIDRMIAAFDLPAWRENAETSQNSVSAWINPPSYTGLPPIVLRLSEKEQRLSVPVGSILAMRYEKKTPPNLSIEPVIRELEKKDRQEDANTTIEQRQYLLEKDHTITVKTGFFRSVIFKISMIPLKSPSISVNGNMVINRSGSFILPVKIQDDYGISDVKAVFSLAQKYDSLVPAPEVKFQFSSRNRTDQDIKQTIDLTDHPWAGLPVHMTLVARNIAGLDGRSVSYNMVLPERPFTVPLAKAIVEQRRRLILEPDQTALVSEAVQGLLVAPEYFSTNVGVFLGLRHAQTLLYSMTNKADQIDLSDWFWAMALDIEEGTLSDAERALRAAQARLQESVARGASQEEIDRLSFELRQAINRYLQELSSRMARNQNQNDVTTPGGQVVSQDQLSQMLNQFEELMRQGRNAEAQKLLEQLRNIFDNMQTTTSNTLQNDPMVKEMMQTMRNASSLLSDQQKLLDETYDQSRKQLLYPEGSKANKSNGEFERLMRRQQDLGARLEDLKSQSKKLGLEPDRNFNEATEAMREAQTALSNQDGQEATEAQGAAVKALNQAMQNMMQQGQQMFGGASPMAGGKNDNGGASWNPFTGKMDTLDRQGRVYELINQLRNRLSEPNRPKDELDYLERLLRQ